MQDLFSLKAGNSQRKNELNTTKTKTIKSGYSFKLLL